MWSLNDLFSGKQIIATLSDRQKQVAVNLARELRGFAPRVGLVFPGSSSLWRASEHFDALAEELGAIMSLHGIVIESGEGVYKQMTKAPLTKKGGSGEDPWHFHDDNVNRALLGSFLSRFAIALSFLQPAPLYKDMDKIRDVAVLAEHAMGFPKSPVFGRFDEFASAPPLNVLDYMPLFTSARASQEELIRRPLAAANAELARAKDEVEKTKEKWKSDLPRGSEAVGRAQTRQACAEESAAAAASHEKDISRPNVRFLKIRKRVQGKVVCNAGFDVIVHPDTQAWLRAAAVDPAGLLNTCNRIVGPDRQILEGDAILQVNST